jgi:hypothetical protein
MLKQAELFKVIISDKLTPNQYYILMYIVYKSLTELPSKVTPDIQVLITRGYIIISNENKVYVTESGKRIVKKVESMFIKTAENSAGDILGDEWEERIQEYINIFPAIRLNTGKYARDTPANIKSAFKWFFKTYDYSWDLILDATEEFVDEYRMNGFKFMCTSRYFIRKQQIDKTYISELAIKCQQLLDGSDEPPIISSVKVV